MVKAYEFDENEFREILKRGTYIVERGYFTGINFIQSKTALPDESIVIHFLHDSELHLEQIVRRIDFPYLISPRFTYYRLDPKYLGKKNFEEEYRNAEFYDENFDTIPLAELMKNPPKVINVANDELDLIIPLSGNNLADLVARIQEADKRGPFPWVDPVIIVKIRELVETLPGFKGMMHYVGIMREREGFYTVIHEDSRTIALKKYLRKICRTRPQIGKLCESSVTFNLSQINQEFFDYIVKNVLPFEPVQ